MADHWNLDADVGGLHEVVWYPVVLVPEQHDGSLPCGLQQCERCGIFGELNCDDAPAGGPLSLEPALLAGVEPVDAWPTAVAERVIAPRQLIRGVAAAGTVFTVATVAFFL